MNKFIGLSLFGVSAMMCLLSCGSKKTENQHQQEEANSKVEQAYPPIGLYYGLPTSMLGNTSGYEIAPSNLPDFVSYPNDLVKMGLKGRVKSVTESVSTFAWSYSFNTDGNLVDYQFRMDSKGRYGEGAKAEYNESGELTLLGRNYRGQSPHSHTYAYKNGKLFHRSDSRGERIYYYHDGNGIVVPDSVVTKGLTPYLDIKFTEQNGMILVGGITYKKPSLPGNLSAANAESVMEYSSDGQLKYVQSVYNGIKGYKAPKLYGLTEYTYNDHGDVEKQEKYLFTDKEPLTNPSLRSRATYHGIDTFEYQYDDEGNWIQITMSSQPKSANTISLNSMSRTIEYYSEEELLSLQKEKKEMEEKPYVGIWSFTNTEDMGDGIKYNYSATIALNLYEKFMPEGGDVPQWGIVYSGMNNTLGKTRNGSFNITEFKISGNTIKINMEEMFSGEKYSAKLEYNPADKSMTMKDVNMTEEGEDSMTDIVQEPMEEKYSYRSRSTSPN